MNTLSVRGPLAALTLSVVTAALLLAPSLPSRAAQGLRVDPSQPRYLNWNGRPMLIVGSGEHYGAVLNTEFDYVRYLKTLSADGLNHTRLFTGAAYVEPAGAFNIERNTLAPSAPHYLAPWARSDQPGYALGGNRFDLEHWNEAYFDRLRSFVREAGRRRVIVEVNLFCPFYEDIQWRLSPFHPDNNIHGAGRDVGRTNVYTLDRHGGLLAHQERFVDKVVETLRPFDNLYYEICNEPYFAGVTLEWQAHIAARIAQAQKSHRRPKLISQNIANDKARVDAPLPNISLYNFHYATPPDTVAMNRHLNLPIGDNEDGFRGTNNIPYRIEAWDFLLAGGALFSHLDYSFAVGFEDGTFAYPKSQPGGGNPVLRSQFSTLRRFLESLPFTRMDPDPSVTLKTAPGLPPISVRALTAPGRATAAYLHTALDGKTHIPLSNHPLAAEVNLPLSAGRWHITWIAPESGQILHTETLRTDGSPVTLRSPYFGVDLALAVTHGRPFSMRKR